MLFAAHHPHPFSKHAHAIIPNLLLPTYPLYLVQLRYPLVPSYSSCPSVKLHTSLSLYSSQFISKVAFDFLFHLHTKLLVSHNPLKFFDLSALEAFTLLATHRILSISTNRLLLLPSLLPQILH